MIQSDNSDFRAVSDGAACEGRGGTAHVAKSRFKRLLLSLCGWIVVASALILPRAGWSEVFYGITNNAIYSVDTVSGGPPTTLFTFSPALNSGVTLALRPSDGVLFFLDTQGANPTLRSWDPATPSTPPVVIGTLGVAVSGVIRLGFDAVGNLYAANGGTGASVWRVDPNSGAILSTIPQSGAVTLAGSGDVCLQPGTSTLFAVAGTSLFTVDVLTGVNTLRGAMALPGNATGCAFDSNGRLVVSQGGSNQLYAVNIGSLAVTALPQTTGAIGFLDLATGPARTADLRVSKTATNITPANTVSFTVTVTNDGPDRATDVRIVDVLPAGVTLVSATASQGSYNAAALTPDPAGTWRVGTLNSGASATLTFNATVAGATNTATNTAQVYYVDQRDPDSVPNNNNAAEDDQASVTINRSADLQVVKAATSSFAVGLNGTYTLSVNNLLGSLATSGNYTVVDPMPAGLSIVGTPAGSGWDCTASTAAQLSCTSSTVIAAGASNPNPITFTVAVAAGAFPSVSNTATVAGGGELNLPNFTSNNSNTLITPVCAATCPDLRPNKSLTAPSTTSLTVGTNSTYTLSVTNIGGLTTGTNLYTLTDTLPAGLTLAAVPTVGATWSCPANSPSAGDNTVGGSRVVCTSTTALAPGATSANVVIQVAVANTAVPNVTNTATVSGGGDPNTGNNTVNLTNPVIDFDLTVTKTKTVAGNFVLGVNTATYTVVVNNIGGRTSTGTYTVTDVLPAGLTLNAAPTVGAGWTCAANTPLAGDNVAGGGRVVCTNATAIAPAGTSTSIVFPVRVGTGVGPSVTNTATVSNPNESPNLLTNNASTVTTPVNAPDLIVTKTHTGNFVVGTPGVYTITVFNIGAQATGAIVTITDTLPAGMTFVSGTGTGWNPCTAVLQVVTCTRPAANTIAAGVAAPPITLTVTPTVAGTVTNNISVAGGGEPTGNTGNNSDADITAVFFAPVIAKAFSTTPATAPATITAGAVATLTLTISNPAGNSAALTGVAVVDPFPAGMVVAATPAFTSTCGGTMVSGNIQGDTVISLTGGGPVAPGASCTISVNVTSTTIGVNTNTTGQVSSTNSGIGNSASATLTVTAPGAPVLTKISNPDPAGVNQLVALTFTIVNKATTTNDMAFTDTFPAGVVYRGTVAGGTCTSSSGTAFALTNQFGAALVAGTSTGIRVVGIDLAANASCTIIVNVSSATPGSYANTNANISGLAGGLTANVNDTLVVVGTTLTKAFSPVTIAVSQSSNLTFTITNGTGAPPQGGLAFTETLPSGMTVAAAPVPTQCSGSITAAVGGNSITLAGGTLASGQASCDIVVPVRANAVGTYNNLPANVTGLSAGMTNSATATLTVVTGVALTMTKTVFTVCDPFKFNANPKAIPGAYVRYEIAITNAAGALTSATLTTIGDVLDPNLDFDADLRSGSAAACATSAPESAPGRGFKLTCAGGSRACNTPVFFTSAADSDAIGIAGSAITLTFGDGPAGTKALPTETGYAPGELKPGETVTIRFNVIVK